MLIVGLGNPGSRYAGTRHNVGFDVVREICASRGVLLHKPLFRPLRWSGKLSQTLAIPLTYMNGSGSVFPWLLRKSRLGPADVVVVTDNMDLIPGDIRLKQGGSTRSHNGIASIIDAIGPDFLRIYVGIGRPAEITVVDHVLSVPGDEERARIDQAISRAVRAAELLIDRSPDEVMNVVNRRS